MQDRKDDLTSNFFRASRKLGRVMHAQYFAGEQPGAESPMMHHGQGRLLHKIAERQPVSQKDLVDMLDIRPSSLSELLKKLDAKGLVERKQDENDKRNVIVSLTEAGAEAEKQGRESRGENAAKLFEGLTAEEQVQLNELLKKLVASWKEKYGDEMLGRGHGCRHGFGHGFGHGPHMHHRKMMFFGRW